MTSRGMITLSALFALMFLGCTLAGSVHRRILREISAETLTPQPGNTVSALTTTTTTTGTPEKPLCSYSEPCGWAVYKKFTRVFEYYMENTCRCPSHKHCHRTGDDLSINSYVYTCIAEEINETIMWVHPPKVYTPEPNWHEDMKERLKHLAPTTTPAPEVKVNGNIYDQ